MTFSWQEIGSKGWRVLVLALASLLVLFALVVGVGRECVKEVERFHGSIESWFSQVTGLDVQFARIHGEWTQTSPELHFFDVSLSNPDSSYARPVRISRLSVRVSLTDTLLSLYPRLRLRVYGLHAEVDHVDDHFELLGKPLTSGKSSSVSPFAALFRAQPRVSIYNSHLAVRGLYSRRTNLSLSLLKLFWRDQHANLEGRAVIRGPDEMKVAITSKIRLMDQQKIRGTTYFSFAQAQLSKWIPEDIAGRLPVDLNGAKGESQLWLHWAESELSSATFKFDWRSLELARGQKSPVDIDRVAGIARWQGLSKDAWHWGLRDLLVERAGALWRPGPMRLNAVRDGNNEWVYRADLDRLVISTEILPLLERIPMPPDIGQAVSAMRPSGQLNDLFVILKRKGEQWTLMQAQGELSDYSQQAWGQLPGLHHAGAAFYFEGDRLWLDFDEKSVTLDYPSLFRAPLLLDRVHGALAVTLETDRMMIRSSPLGIETRQGKADARFQLELPQESDKSAPQMGLQVTLRDISASNVPLYLPAGVMSEKLLIWLDTALKGGTLTQGDIIFNGPLRKPELTNARSLLLRFQVRDGELQFLPDWQEPIKNLVAEVIVENGLIQATAKGGEYYGLHLGDVEVSTARVADATHLYVHTTAKGQASDGARLLQDSPLGKFFKRPLSDIALSGELEVTFALDAPFIADASLAGMASVRLSQGLVQWPSQRLSASNVELALTYDLQKGLESQKLEADVLEGKVKGRLFQKSLREGRTLTLELEGETPTSALNDWLKIAPMKRLKGTLPYSLRLEVPPASLGVPATLQLKSSMVGVAVALPEPFAKKTSYHRPLEIVLTLAGNRGLHYLRYGDIVAMQWEKRDGHLARGSIHFGPGDPVLPQDQTWRLSGQLARFRWDEWAEIADAGEAEGPGSASPFSLLSQLGDSNITIKRLFLGDKSLGEVSFFSAADIHHVTVTANGDHLRGHLILPRTYLDAPAQRGSEMPVSLYLKKLVLPSEASRKVAQPDAAMAMLPPSASMDPRRLPAAHVRIDQLVLGDKNVGRYNMTLTPTQKGLDIENVLINLNKVDFSGKGEWIREGNEASTHFSGQGRTIDVAEVLRAWGYVPSIDSQSAVVEMDLRWPGAPHQFSVARAHGDVRAHIKKGHFLKVGNNAVGRVWGLLNFETWLSRMRLRFSDLRDDTMPFEDIHGAFSLHNNRIDVSKLRVDSPALKMRMDGLVDMSERQLKMQWAVTVPVTRNLMLPAAMMGGIPGAATAYVIDKVFSDQLDKLTTLTYDVTGSFEDPRTDLRPPLR